MNEHPTAWEPPAGAFWNGAWRNASTALAVHDPENGTLVGQVSDCSPADVDAAVEAVTLATLDPDGWPLWQRRTALNQAARLLADRAALFVHLISREGCKPVRDAEQEVRRATETVRLSAEQGDRLEGRTLPFGNTPRGANRIGWYTREPIGVVGAITPFNDPLNLVAHKVAPALIGGNGVVLKPAEQTPLTALAFLEVLLEAGIPADRIAVLPGRGATVGAALVGHTLVDMVSFTGGWASGNAVARTAGAKKTLMELGGNGTVIVLSDADVPRAAAAIVDGAFANAGQNCLSVQRVFVARNRAQELVDLVVDRTEDLVVGSKTDPRTDVGPLVDEAGAERVESWVDEAVEAGATLLIGGKRDGAFFWPTVLTDVPAGSRVLTDEIFGPVVSIESFEDVNTAVREANRSDYGLQAGVFTHDLDSALAVARALRVGAVMVNDTCDYRIDAMPFGGGKRSGVGREGVPYAVDAMTEPKIIAIHTSA
ncbi:aldehyde dehydrogenase family protein [Kribbella sp. NPDC050820]|uniref:aldehyde dehydrogenase family protein n=1 Tax=Kribbella sp. NPDC050820 TaxID=3155408 RepID=UPI0033DE64D1